MNVQRLMSSLSTRTVRPLAVILMRRQSTTRAPRSIVGSESSPRTTFLNTFPRFLDMAVKCNYEHVGDYPTITVEHFKRLMSYVVPIGSLHAPLLTLGAARLFRGRGVCFNDDDDDDDDQHERLSNVMSWCSQMQCMGILMVDDILDKSPTRYGKKSWFKQDGVGMTAIHDAFLLLHAMHNVVKANFGNKPVYLDLLDSFTQCGFKVSSGQALDAYVDQTPMRAKLNRSAYENIVKHKTSSILSELIKRGIQMNGITDPEVYANVEDVCTLMGLWKQIDNDRQDVCFESGPQALGTDIAEGRSTWLVVKALELASKEQIAIIEENYGKYEEGCAERVKEVYVELEIDAHCQVELDTIVRHIQEAPCQPTWKLPRDFNQYLFTALS